MNRNVKHERVEKAKRAVRLSGTYHHADGTPIDNKPHNLVGEAQRASLVRGRLKRGQRRRVNTELLAVTKTAYCDGGEDADVRGKLMPNLISASSHITS